MFLAIRQSVNPHVCLSVTHNKRKGTHTIAGLTSIWYISLISFSVFAFRSSFEVYMCVIVFGWPEGLILKDCRSGAISSSGVNTRTYRGWEREHIMEWLYAKTHLYGSICWWEGGLRRKQMCSRNIITASLHNLHTFSFIWCFFISV